MLRVVGGGDHQVPGGVGDEEVEPELGGALEDRVAGVTQVLHVAGVAVVLPVGVRHPGGGLGEPGGGLGEPGGGGPVVQAGVPPGGGLVEGHPARGARRVAEQGLGAGPAGCHEAGDEALVGRGGLGQVGGVGGPVVHLEVDIDVVVGAPGWVDAVVPHALEVGGQGRVVPGGGDEQVAAVLGVEGLQGAVLLGGALVGGQGLGGVAAQGPGAQVQAHPGEQGGVVGLVGLPDGLPA